MKRPHALVPLLFVAATAGFLGTLSLAVAYVRIGDRAAAALERQRAEQVRAKKPAA